MHIWIIKTGEPLNFGINQQRLHRASMIANYLVKRGHSVERWTSTFDHYSKKQLFNKDSCIKVNNNYEINLIYSSGYKKNISIKRLIDHYILAKRFYNFKKKKNLTLSFVLIQQLALRSTPLSSEKNIMSQ